MFVPLSGNLSVSGSILQIIDKTYHPGSETTTNTSIRGKVYGNNLLQTATVDTKMSTNNKEKSLSNQRVVYRFPECRQLLLIMCQSFLCRPPILQGVIIEI